MNTADRNICIFSHYDRHSHVRDYVHFYVESLVSAGFMVLFISTADQVRPADRDRLEAIGVEVHIRENKGIDFGSWQYGLNEIKNIEDVGYLVLANDSVFGPFFDLNYLFSQMSQLDVDFWGITDSYYVTWHLQSYFLCFNRNVIRSEAFGKFFEKDFRTFSKRQVISRGEIALSQQLIQAGFRGVASCPYNLLIDDIYDGPHNPTHNYWDRLIERHRCPFLKVQLLRDNPKNMTSVAHWRDVLSRATDYDTTLIEDHLATFGEAPPKRSLLLVVHRRAMQSLCLLKLVFWVAIKAASNPRRTIKGLEQFVAADLSKMPSHPGPSPTSSYVDQGAAKSSHDA